MTKKKLALDAVNPQAAGIDVGSRSHYVAIGQTDEDVKEFGVYNEDLQALTKWLVDNEIKTVAMESTGTYWQSLFATLQNAGLEVLLCNGKFTKNIKGKKTDVQDCQWIQKLHTKDTALSNFFKRIAFRKGRTSAISATARKLAVIIWNMITRKVPYKTDTQYEFLDQKESVKY